MPNLNPNSTNYVHSSEPNTNSLEMAMDYNSVGQPVIRTIGGDIYNSINLPAGFGQIHKFGAVPAMSQDTNGTIWDEDDTIYPWSTIDSNGVLTVSVVAPNNENNTRNTHSGDTVEIQGLDSNYELQTETVTISGSSATTTNNFKRVFRASYSCTDNFEPNSERILIKSGTTTVAKILEGIGQTLMSISQAVASPTPRAIDR
tara:strand:- start:1 stop:606 length:606 start_codon:yes stop_codon:yes gene_type:complete